MKHFFNKRYWLYTLSVIGLSMACLSCNKLLDIPSHPDDKISTDALYTDSANVMGALVGLYANFKVGGNGPTVFGGDLTLNAGMYADELEPTTVNDVNEFLVNDLQAGNGTVNSLWSATYTGIYQVNAFLEGITDNNKISVTLQRQARGEALLTRALYYFYLVNLYGAVPYITTTDYATNAQLPRSSVDSIYNLITTDLSTAINLLPVKYPSVGRARPNLRTAQALLARVYLYRGQWKQAADLASQIISDPVYRFAELDKMFLEGSTEAIWQVQSVANFNPINEVNYLTPSSGSQQPTYGLTTRLVNAFEANDKRSAAWVRTVTVNNVTYTYPWKYRNRDVSTTPKEFFMLFRLAEQYLIRAEANARQDLLDTAIADINRIRGRAGLGATSAAGREQVLLAIEKERQTELFCELGQRWFDLKRTGRAGNVLSPIKPKWNATDTLLPIPAAQRQNNPFLTQNPGYF